MVTVPNKLGGLAQNMDFTRDSERRLSSAQKSMEITTPDATWRQETSSINQESYKG